MVVGVGLFNGWYMDAVGGVRKGIHLDVAVLSVGMAVLGILLAWSVFVKGYISPERGFEVFGALHTTFKEQFFTEKIYHSVFAAGYLTYSKVLYLAGERRFIDGLVNGVALVVQSVGSVLRFFQSGKLNWYVFWLASGLALLVLLVVSVIYGGDAHG
ncbi:MAG TPA: hypothetical protein EYP11_06665 [Aquificaceae bacterium]|nr:hypothetical protein [Aquificaceae bacterium]